MLKFENPCSKSLLITTAFLGKVILNHLCFLSKGVPNYLSFILFLLEK